MEDNLLSIGELSRLTHIPVATIRNWEHRYGAPVADRLPSGHRRYSLALVEKLKLVRLAVASGYKPSLVLKTSLEELQALLKKMDSKQRRQKASETQALLINSAPMELMQLFEAIRRMDGREVEILLTREWMQGGARKFVYGWAMQFLKNSEPLYATYMDSIALKHYAIEQIQSFLCSRWMSMSNTIGTKDIVLTCLSNDYNLLALHMAATLAVTVELGVLFLGGNTPVSEIAEVAKAHGVKKILVALCPASDVPKSEGELQMLGELRNQSIDVAVGGNASLTAIEGVFVLRSFNEMETWMRKTAM
ncbi:MAG: MerR family transcriptional regulator [Deltaproteobacteria bacterium]|nr:MerR family transcriptional regulator [Deltaproteobacteria bacterium]